LDNPIATISPNKAQYNPLVMAFGMVARRAPIFAMRLTTMIIQAPHCEKRGQTLDTEDAQEMKCSLVILIAYLYHYPRSDTCDRDGSNIL
jgi:hypothetical protein